jgi:hypothetical protein
VKEIPKANESEAGQNQIRCDPIRLAGADIGQKCHICAFFHDREEENRILLPFIKDALKQGQKFVHTVDPQRRREQIQFLESAGIDVARLIEKGQLEIRDWNSTHLLNGQFDSLETLKVFKGVVDTAQEKGFPVVRFATHMEWAIEGGLGKHELLEYEAKSNAIWDNQDGAFNPVICTYDLKKFGGDILVDIIRTHPLIIIGGILQENPFYVPAEKFLRELQARGGTGPEQNS